MKLIKSINEINMNTPEGILALELLARLTATIDSNKQPDEVIQLVSGTIREKEYEEAYNQTIKAVSGSIGNIVE